MPKFDSSPDLQQPLLIHPFPEEAAEPCRLVPLWVQVCPSVGRTIQPSQFISHCVGDPEMVSHQESSHFPDWTT